MRRIKNKGFTLLELLVIGAILGLITLVIGSVFAAGIRVYQRAKHLDVFEADVFLCLDRFEKDLRNAFNFAPLDFKWGEKDIRFTGIMSGSVLSIGRIGYYLDEGAGLLIREEEPYPGTLSKKVSVLGSGAFRVEELRFKYYYFDPKTKKYFWRDSWELTGGIPPGVEVNLILKDEDTIREYARKVFLPLAK